MYSNPDDKDEEFQSFLLNLITWLNSTIFSQHRSTSNIIATEFLPSKLQVNLSIMLLKYITRSVLTMLFTLHETFLCSDLAQALVGEQFVLRYTFHRFSFGSIFFTNQKFGIVLLSLERKPAISVNLECRIQLCHSTVPKFFKRYVSKLSID